MENRIKLRPLNYKERKAMFSIDWLYALKKYIHAFVAIHTFNLYISSYINKESLLVNPWDRGVYILMLFLCPAIVPAISVVPSLYRNFLSHRRSLKTTKENTIRKIGKYYICKRSNDGKDFYYYITDLEAEAGITVFDENTILDLTGQKCKEILDQVKSRDEAQLNYPII